VQLKASLPLVDATGFAFRGGKFTALA